MRRPPPARASTTASPPRAAPDSLAELERALARATTRDERQRFHRGVAERAGVDISPGATWALVRIDEHGFAGAREQAERQGVTQERIAEVVAELRGRGLVAGEEGAPEGTPAGRALHRPGRRRAPRDAGRARRGGRGRRSTRGRRAAPAARAGVGRGAAVARRVAWCAGAALSADVAVRRASRRAWIAAALPRKRLFRERRCHYGNVDHGSGRSRSPQCPPYASARATRAPRAQATTSGRDPAAHTRSRPARLASYSAASAAL